MISRLLLPSTVRLATVVPGPLARRHTDQDDLIQGMVGVAVTASAEPVTDCFARGRGYGCDPDEGSELGLISKPVPQAAPSDTDLRQRGLLRNDTLATSYRQWLAEQQQNPLMIMTIQGAGEDVANPQYSVVGRGEHACQARCCCVGAERLQGPRLRRDTSLTLTQPDMPCPKRITTSPPMACPAPGPSHPRGTSAPSRCLSGRLQ